MIYRLELLIPRSNTLLKLLVFFVTKLYARINILRIIIKIVILHLFWLFYILWSPAYIKISLFFSLLYLFLKESITQAFKVFLFLSPNIIIRDVSATEMTASSTSYTLSQNTYRLMLYVSCDDISSAFLLGSKVISRYINI